MKLHWTWVSAIVLLGTSVVSSQPSLRFEPALNIARGRSYTLSPSPNYSLTTDAGDSRQLTDGTYSTVNPIWIQTSTVGWANASPVTIVIDLQSVQPIAGVSYSTAAGKAGVDWPRSIFVLTSDDGQHYFPAADLARLPPGATGPPASGYAAFRYSSNALRTHGRYVAIMVDAVGPYVFCDEIEVLGGDRTWLNSPLPEPSTTDLQQFFTRAHMGFSIHRRLSSDLDGARAALAASGVGSELRSRLTNEMNLIGTQIDAAPAPEPASFRAVLPLNDLHASIFRVQGAIAQANGLPALTAWSVNPWDFARPLDKPGPSGLKTVSVAAMNGETRSGAISVANSTDQATTASLRITSRDGSNLSDLALYEVLWTDTRELIPVADALVPLTSAGASLKLPAGMTRQIWLRFSPKNRAPGTYAGDVEITTDAGHSSRVPFELTVIAGQFPARPTLHLGGWDYTDTNDRLGVTPNNREALVRELRALNVDSPWASAGVMPFGSFDSRGRLTGTPNTSNFDNWVARWPDASRYSVFLSVGDAIGGVPSSDAARFATAVGQWIAFWVGHAAEKRIQGRQLMLLLVDEPQTAAQDDRIVLWARAIKAAAPGVGIWEDPTYPYPARSRPRLLNVSDVLALKRSLIVQQGASFVSFYRRRALRGQALEVYGASGPARLLDPYTYNRLQAWMSVDLGATTSFFWSFADDAEGHSWNEYATLNAPYSPFFLSDTQVTISKHTEAIREGVEDVEYLTMLRQRTAAVASRDPNRPGLSDVRRLAARATRSVLQTAGIGDFEWINAKDRSAAETTRLELARALNSSTLMR